ncbi:zinc finger CCCH-type with G patch domain-containing protein-like isoform X2 [Adelges cooleyi]|uniref:zinc finger CCCH-type with G patch domain-containing protein-like isoform X2 n=1 Tax=Adelges cooleyi TaxID=133065 RepID=UPI00218007B0|nr:zinc finger CCCH-type with G patch domain-containing protein-like isoform X2 [Adelges cooleyi]
MISSDDENSNSQTVINNNIIDYSNKIKEIKAELENLRGMKCQSPFKYGFSRPILCNAVIMSFTLKNTTFPMSLDNVLVTVLYLNPTSNPMVPCKYWVDGECMYSDQDCKFSHGTQVPLTSITNYIEPNFEHLRIGSLVLANTYKGCLWSKAVVLDIEYGTSIKDGTCLVRYNTIGLGVARVPMHDIYPGINKYDEYCHTNYLDYNNMGKIVARNEATENKVLQKRTKLGSSESLGDWEKYTKGIGSKIMAKMGYIKGTGLGKNNKGRVEPAVATVLPKRQSLDYCIAIENENHRMYLQRKLKKVIMFARKRRVE